MKKFSAFWTAMSAFLAALSLTAAILYAVDGQFGWAAVNSFNTIIWTTNGVLGYKSYQNFKLRDRH